MEEHVAHTLQPGTLLKTEFSWPVRAPRSSASSKHLNQKPFWGGLVTLFQDSRQAEKYCKPQWDVIIHTCRCRLPANVRHQSQIVFGWAQGRSINIRAPAALMSRSLTCNQATDANRRKRRHFPTQMFIHETSRPRLAELASWIIHTYPYNSIISNITVFMP